MHVCLSQSRTICWMRWKLLPWKLKACSNSTLSSTVHSSGKGVKFARSASERSTSCLCHNNIPRAWWSQKSGNQEKFRSEDRKKYKHLSFCFWCPYLLHVVSVFLLSHEDVLVHWKNTETPRKTVKIIHNNLKMVKENEEKTKKMNRNRKQRDEEEKGKREKEHKCTGRDSREF